MYIPNDYEYKCTANEPRHPCHANDYGTCDHAGDLLLNREWRQLPDSVVVLLSRYSLGVCVLDTFSQPLYSPVDGYIPIGDESMITKAGKHTYDLDHLFPVC